jgi:hypothetical protein
VTGTYTAVGYREADAVGGGLHFLREDPGCEHLGLDALEAEPGWTGKPHDHAADGQKEAHSLVDEATERDRGAIAGAP